MRLQSSIIALIAPLALAAHLRITIPSSPMLPLPSNLPPSTTASLTTLFAHHSAPLRLDNTFVFRNVSTGSYLLDIRCPTHAFHPLRVDVHDTVGAEQKVEAWGTFRGNEWGNKGEVASVSRVDGRTWGFDARVQGPKEYLQERSGFSPLSILKNPMILIAIASMGVVFGMPYLMDNMDPELKAEFEERQKSSAVGGGAAANPLQNFDAAAWLAGTGKKDTEKTGKITR